jgi:hypothetical protein
MMSNTSHDEWTMTNIVWVLKVPYVNNVIMDAVNASIEGFAPENLRKHSAPITWGERTKSQHMNGTSCVVGIIIPSRPTLENGMLEIGRQVNIVKICTGLKP